MLEPIPEKQLTKQKRAILVTRTRTAEHALFALANALEDEQLNNQGQYVFSMLQALRSVTKVLMATNVRDA